MNIDMDDHELLREFVRRRSEDAFRQLVERHLRMVLSAARRMSGDDYLAQDVTQNVFTMFAQKARDIRPPQVVGGWLYNTTRHLAMHAVRGERRRREREEAAVAMQAQETNAETERVLEQLEPAMAELDADDRDTLVLRYLEDCNLRDVGAEFGISEDAARMRANRALEKLRTVLSRKGVTVTSVLLGSALVSSTSSAVPAGLAAAITTTAIGGTILTTATITTMNWINAKAMTAIVGAAVVAGTGTYLVKETEANRLRDENQKLLAQQAALVADNEAASKQAQATADELARAKKDASDVVRLRGEMAQLRRQRDAEKQQMAQQPANLQRMQAQTASAAPAATEPPANVISKERMANVGFATPENALQTIVWATMSGKLSPEQITEALSPEFLKDKEAYAIFEQNRQQSLPVFKSVEMQSKKTVDENTVEFKGLLHVDLGPNAPAVQPSVVVLPMTKAGGLWKLAGNPKEYKEGWENGHVQPFGQ
ncbi:MAG TPA: sigma-70 family RNA polymerase sigma factor [Verrucomicrobiae bacterium]|nr:sigma-70 family RNA polymerase sigma factor [Verrucomicrobiae bacterium]